MRIIGYTYDADCHCIGCTQKRFAIPINYKRRGLNIEADENGVNPLAKDTEGNDVHPIFSTDEHPPEGIACGSCHTFFVQPEYREF